MKLVLAVALGGAIGAVARYQSVVWISRLIGLGFPWGTLFVNIVGSFVMGLFIEFFTLRTSGGQEFRAFFAVGVLGSFTTFSSFSLDVAMLYERGHLMAAGGYILASVALSIFGLFSGLWVMRTVVT
ncbi:MAG: fluoride efflux transporter CrcB [Rhodospirillaceae bacterium]|nr:fluoride efflux transporter CrcB [Rhodospirillaceae bacterium]|tara:strand:+ start:181 stop:561 length:381 start_codon:yes stop_codon:yes gene_type:complete